MPRPYRGRLAAAAELNASCEACHQDEAQEWRRSRHRQSNTNAAYRAAFAVEPSPFCQGCHAPESDLAKEPPKEVSELGVGCVSCHVTEEGGVLAAALSAESSAPEGSAPHRVSRSVEFGLTGGCAGCHEFRFPMGHGDEDGAFMQTTVREHLRSPAASEGCAACHMPAIAGRRSHAFAEVRDPAWLRGHLHVTAELTEDGICRVTLGQPAPGHAFPSGDLFRRLEVGCELRAKSGRALSRQVRYLGRRFEILPGRPERQLTRDDRIFNEPAAVEVEILPPATGPQPAAVAWWVTYQRVANVGIGRDPADVQIESEVKLFSGEVPWQTH